MASSSSSHPPRRAAPAAPERSVSDNGNYPSGSTSNVATPASEPPSVHVTAAEPMGRGVAGVPTVAMMPYAGSPGAPFFEGKNITDFLDRYKDLCQDYNVYIHVAIERLPRYCETRIGQYIKTIPEYHAARDWDALYAVLCEEYRSEDIKQRLESRSFLAAFKDKPRTEADDLRQYCRQFTSISTALLKRHQLDTFTQCSWFLQGLPVRVRERVVRKRNINMNRAETLVYKPMVDLVNEMYLTEEALRELNITRAGAEQLSEMADQYQPKTSMPGWTSLSHEPPVVTHTPKVIVPDTAAEAYTKSVDVLTKSMEALVLPIRAFIERDRRQPGAVSMQANNLRPVNNACHYCKVDGHRRAECPDMHRAIDRREIHVDSNNRICLGPKTANTAPLRLQSGKSQKESVEFAVASQRSAAGVTNVSSLHLAGNDGLGPEDLSTDEEAEDTVDITSAHAGPGYGFGNGMLKDTLRDRAKQEKKYPTTRTVRPGEYGKMTTTTEVVPQGDVAMQDAPTILPPKKSETRQVTFAMPGMEKNPRESQPNRAPRLSDTVRNSTDSLTTMNKILNQPVDKVTVRELLGLSPSLHRNFFRNMGSTGGDDVVGVAARQGDSGVARMSSATTSVMPADDLIPLEKIYSTPTPWINIELEGYQTSAMIDTGAEVNAITLEVATAAGLPIRQNCDLKMQSYQGNNEPFVGVCQDVLVKIGGMTAKSQFFVVGKAAQPVILGGPFQDVVTMGIQRRGRSNAQVTLSSADGSYQVVVPAAAKKQGQTRQESDIFLTPLN